MEPLILEQWYRAVHKTQGGSYIFVCHGRVLDGRYILEQIHNGRFLAVNPWTSDSIGLYIWEPVDVGTIK